MTLFDKQHMRVGYAGGMHKTHRKRANPACANGGFYKTPTSGQSIVSGTSFNMSWDPSCLTAGAVDIYLYAPGASVSRIHLWQNVNFALGSYTDKLQASWWNSTGPISLQLSIVESGTPPFLAALPAGPVFTATVGTSDSGSAVSSNIQNVNNFNTPKAGLSHGKIAAAVILPLLIVGGLILAAWLKLTRAKTEEKSKRWSEAVDKRMSTISTDWKSITPGGASAAIRNSMAVSGETRNSAFSFGAIRPSSTVALEGGQAGIGSKGMYLHENGSFEQPQMSQLRSGPRLSTVGGERVPRISFAADTRVSRVSFATDARPSGESRRGVSRAFHVGEAPPMPILQRQDSSEMSPTQTTGPLSLTPEDIRAHMSGLETGTRPSMDDYMPALSMMRHGGQQAQEGGDLLFVPKEPEMPTPPTPTLAKPVSTGVMPMQPMPANVMSPDEMLRAYAESRRNAGAPTNGGPTFPSPTVSSYDGNGMRTLYSPPASATTFNNPYRKSRAVSEYNDEDAYMGTAN